MRHDTWLQDSSAYETYDGLDREEDYYDRHPEVTEDLDDALYILSRLEQAIDRYFSSELGLAKVENLFAGRDTARRLLRQYEYE